MAVLLVFWWRIRHLEQVVAERERRLALLQTSVADMAHDIKTPLTLLSGPIRDLLDGRYGSMQQEVIKAFERAERNADRMERLTDRMVLDTECLADSGNVNCISHVDAADTVRDVVEQFRAHAERTGIVLEMVTEGSGLKVRADRFALERVVANLVSNALKYTPSTGHVCVDVHAGSFGEKVMIEVQDSGCGIHAEDRVHLFDRFFRSVGAKRTAGGRGVGLNIVYKLVEGMGGTIRVDSEPGKGARFTVELDRETGFPHKTTVVHVGPDVTVGACLVELYKDSWDLKFVRPGEDAVRRISTLLPDFVVSTWSGNVASKLAADLRTSHIPVLEFQHVPFRASELRDGMERLTVKRREVRRAFRSAVLRPGACWEVDDLLSSIDSQFLSRMSVAVATEFCSPSFNENRLAELTGLSLVQLAHKLHTLSGFSVCAFIREIRLGHAAWLLSIGQVTGDSAWKSAGYPDSTTFSMAFRERFNETPSVFAENAAGSTLLTS